MLLCAQEFDQLVCLACAASLHSQDELRLGIVFDDLGQIRYRRHLCRLIGQDVGCQGGPELQGIARADQNPIMNQSTSK